MAEFAEKRLASQPETLAEAARLLMASSSTSAPVHIANMLQTARHALNARSAGFWRIAQSRRSIRAFCVVEAAGVRRSAGSAAILPKQWPQFEARENHGIRVWSREHDEFFPELVKLMEFACGSRYAWTMPLHQNGITFGMLAFEFGADFIADIEKAELFLSVLASQIEVAFFSGAAERVVETENAFEKTEIVRQSYLNMTEQGLRDLFYFAPNAMVVSDPATERVIAANLHALKMFRVAVENSEALKTGDFWVDRNERERYLRMLKQGGNVTEFDAQFRRADGEIFWAQVSSTPINYEGTHVFLVTITDVTEAHDAANVLQRNRYTLHTLLEASPLPLIVTRLDDALVRYCNQKAADMFETPIEGLVGHAAPEFYVNPEDREYFVAKLRENGKVDGFIANLKTVAGQPFWAILSAKTLELDGEKVFMVSFADVTKQIDKTHQLEDLAFRDWLTSAYNRRHFMEAVKVEIARSLRSGQMPSIAIIDIDHFKQINDRYGHDAGDDVLKEFTRFVQSMLRTSDLLARYGGEEFVILFPDTDPDTAHAILTRVQDRMRSRPFKVSGKQVHVSFSGGVAGLQQGGTQQQILSEADQALYNAKRSGRDCVRIYGRKY